MYSPIFNLLRHALHYTSKSENQRKISLQMVMGGSLTLVLIKHLKYIGT